jgi:hypothetical protein
MMKYRVEYVEPGRARRGQRIRDCRANSVRATESTECLIGERFDHPESTLMAPDSMPPRASHSMRRRRSGTRTCRSDRRLPADFESFGCGFESRRRRKT